MRVINVVCALFLAAAVAMQASEIRGTVRSAAGVPLEKGIVTLSTSKFAPAIATANVQRDGTFSIETDTLGGLSLTFAAPDHAPQLRDVFVASSDHTIDVAVTLGTNRPKAPVKEVKILGEFNDWSFEEAVSMEKLPNGTYRYMLPVRNGVAAYQVLVIEDVDEEEQELHSINGTQFDRLEYDGGGDFRSFVQSKQATAAVVFDPNKLPEGKTAASFSFTAPAEAEVQRLVQQVRDPLSAIRSAASQRATSQQEFFDFIFEELGPAELVRVHTQLGESMPNPKRHLLVAKAMGLMRWVSKHTAQDTALVGAALRQIPLDSKVWYLAVGHVVDAYSAVGKIEDALADVRTITGNMGADGADQLAWAMYRVCMAVEGKRKDLFASTYDQLMKDFPNHPAAQQAKTSWDPNKKIVVGKPLPEFSYPSLDNPNVSVTTASLKGKWVLIDLWATWCGPCVAEMPTIMKAWEEFKNDNIVFLSISLDQSADKIAPFREKRFAMPWLHVYREGVFASDASKLFEVTGIPKPILVSPDGVITHITNGLRGPALLDTLRKALRGG